MSRRRLEWISFGLVIGQESSGDMVIGDNWLWNFDGEGKVDIVEFQVFL